MSGLDGDLASVDLETVHLLERVFQILGTVEADLAASLANALMGIGVGDLAALAEDVLQFAPAAARRQIPDSQRVLSPVGTVTSAAAATSSTATAPITGAGSRARTATS